MNAASNERLTWEKIIERYPNQWVGLRNMDRAEDNISIISAVAVPGEMTDLQDAQAEGKFDLVLFTTPDYIPEWMFQPVRHDCAV